MSARNVRLMDVDKGAKIFSGALVACRYSWAVRSWVALPATSSPTRVVIGIANSSPFFDAGTRRRRVFVESGVFRLKTKPNDEPSVGEPCFAVDDQTVCGTDMGSALVGTVIHTVSRRTPQALSRDVFVLIGDPAVVATEMLKYSRNPKNSKPRKVWKSRQVSRAKQSAALKRYIADCDRAYGSKNPRTSANAR